MFSFGERSERNLTGVHPDIIRVLRKAISLGVVDFSVIEGVRTLARQKQLYAQGRTTEGHIVTWTLNSKHIKQDDGYGHAVDLAPYPIDWQNEDKFWLLRGLIIAVARMEGVNLRYLKTNSDLPHYELGK